MIHSEVDRERHHIDARHEKVGKDMSRARLIPNESSRAEINSFGTDEIGPQEWTHIVANFDTGAAVTAIPSVLKQELGLVASETVTRNYKTASGELLADEGGAVLNGYDNDGQGRSVTGRLVNVHRMLVSGSAVGKKRDVGWKHGHHHPEQWADCRRRAAKLEAIDPKAPERRKTPDEHV